MSMDEARTLKMVKKCMGFGIGIVLLLLTAFPVNARMVSTSVPVFGSQQWEATPEENGPGSLEDPLEATPGATPEASTAAMTASCADIPAYVDTLYSTLQSHDVVWKFLAGSDDLEDFTDAQAAAFVEDGKALITDLKGISAPAAYANGHEGITQLIQYFVELSNFYSIDSSVEPPVALGSQANDLIHQGEAEAASACPQEIKSVGGYILFDPSQQ